jgi:antitoxin (DNA-binding transcriptional repressor) of toxin-antitoxin stability system
VVKVRELEKVKAGKDVTVAEVEKLHVAIVAVAEVDAEVERADERADVKLEQPCDQG